MTEWMPANQRVRLAEAWTTAPTTLASVAADASPRRPRVLHLVNSFEIGGTERQAVELLKRLDARRFDVRVAALHKYGPFYDDIAARFPDMPEFPLTSFYNANAMRQLARLCALLVRERIDLLHTHGFYDGLFGVVAARLTGVRVLAAQRHLRLSERRVHIWGTRLIQRLAHRLLVNSDAIRAQILQEQGAPPEKIVVIHNGLMLGDKCSREAERERLCGELQLNRNAQLIGMVARLHPVKGHSDFLAAASQVATAFPQAHFVLVGDGPLRQALEAQALQLRLKSRIHLLGDRADAAQLAAAFDVAVLTSLHEGLPNAVLEAMAVGTPVIATAVGGVLELIRDGETGYLISPGDPVGLAARLTQALATPAERHAIGQRGREFVLKTCDMGQMVQSVERLYDELMVGSVVTSQGDELLRVNRD